MIFITKIVTFYHQRVFISPQFNSAMTGILSVKGYHSKKTSAGLGQILLIFHESNQLRIFLGRKICLKPFFVIFHMLFRIESLEPRMNFMVKFLTYCTYYVATVVLKSGQSRPVKSLF